MTSAVDDDTRQLSELEVKREVLRLRFAMSRLRMEEALAELQGEATQSTPMRIMGWARSPLVRALATMAVVGVLVGALRYWGLRRPAQWLARSLSIWQVVRPLLVMLGFPGEHGNAAAHAPAATAADAAATASP